MNWFYSLNNQPAGPVEDAEFARLVETGVITGTTLVWHGGLTNWQPYDDVRRAAQAGAGAVGQLAAAPSPLAAGAATEAGQAQCSQCGRVFPEDEVVRVEQYPVCAACKPLLVQKLREGVLGGGGLAGARPFAGFWIRTGAAFLDAVILLPAYVVLYAAYFFVFGARFADLINPQNTESMLALQKIGILFALGVAMVQGAYSAFCVSRFGATPGKRICELRIVRGSGEPVTFWRAYSRYFAKALPRTIPILGLLYMLLDYGFVCFDAESRALHDQLCDTRVIHSK